MIPEIDIWRAANLMLKRYGEKALEESDLRADDSRRPVIRTASRSGRRISVAVAQLANTTPPGPAH